MSAAPRPSPTDSRREREVFLGALEFATAPERAAYLDRACAGNPALRTAVDALLECHRDDTFLERAAVALPPSTGAGGPTPAAESGAAESLGPGDVIGRYKLLQQIGEGGAGTVFMAEQEEPVRRRVALKIIKPGMDSRSVIARFETERQALAMMDHPNIAKVLDAGAIPESRDRPFFVMELVRGTRITTFCEENHLSTRQRLRLFIQVCQAIQHAHQKGIIHRDVKPSNILVTLHDGIPVPKVIDFGIAKAIGQRLTDKTVFTEFRAFIGTPAYMSPEQAEMSGLDIDTRTDVYSLGVLLYELLTGRAPFDAEELAASGLDGMRRTIREREPLAPSTRLRSMVETERTRTAGSQRLEPARLENLLSGDLDWIVLKALEKDRTRRYATALGLAQDVQNYLDDEPVNARPPSAAYRFRKLARRNRLTFAVIGAFATALILGLALATWQYLEKSEALRQIELAEREQRALRKEAERAQVREFQLRRQAEDHEFRARQRAYAADINLAQHALEANNLGRARELLNRQIPLPTEVEVRGWEWRHLALECRSDALFALPAQTAEITALAVSADGRLALAGTSAGELAVFDLRTRREIGRLGTGGGRFLALFSPVTPLIAFSAAEGPLPPGAPVGPPPPGGPGGWRQRLRLWDPVERRFAGEFPLPAPPLCLAFSPDGTRVAAVTGDGRLRIWNVADGTEERTRTLPGLRTPFGVARLSADFRHAAYTTMPGTLRVCATETGQLLWSARAAEESVRCLAFSADGAMLASGAGYAESAIRLWNTTNGTELARLDGHQGWISSLVFWPDGTRLASASADQTIRLWNLAGLLSPPAPNAPGVTADATAAPAEPAERREIVALRGHQLEVWSLALAPDRTTLISGSKDGSLLVWDANTRRRDHDYLTLPEPARVWCFSPDSKSVITGDPRGRVMRWTGEDFQNGEPLLELGEGYTAQLFSPDLGLVVAQGPPGRPLRLWDLARRAPVEAWRPPEGPLQPLGFITTSNAPPRLLTRRFPDGEMQEWDLNRSESVRTWPGAGGPGPLNPAWSADARWWLFAGERGQVQLAHDAERLVVSLELSGTQPHTAAFSPDGRRFAIVGGSGTGELWETTPPRRVAPITGFLQGMASVAFSADGRRVVIGSDGREALKIWDAENGFELVTLAAEGSKFQSPAFSPDGRLLGARSGRGIVCLWRGTAADLARETP